MYTKLNSNIVNIIAHLLHCTLSCYIRHLKNALYQVTHPFKPIYNRAMKHVAICLGCVMCRYTCMTHYCCGSSASFSFLVQSQPTWVSLQKFHMKPTSAHMMMKYSLVSINTDTPILLKKAHFMVWPSHLQVQRDKTT